MKLYNLSEIMKRAHNLYNSTRAKYSTFAEVARCYKLFIMDIGSNVKKSKYCNNSDTLALQKKLY